MKQRQKRNITIGILCCMLVFMGIGYAALQQVLTINGTGNINGSWKIEITSITPEGVNEGVSVSEEILPSKTEGSFTANLKKPTDAVVYTVTVENKGTIDAVLESITPDSVSGDIKFRTEGKELCEALAAGETCDFTITVEYLDTGLGQQPTPNGTTITKDFEIKYVQEGANVNTPGGGSGGEVDDTPAITVDSNGLVTGYNKEKLTNEEGYVVIPATTEKGEEIVSIDSGSFAEYNVAMGYGYNEETEEEIAGFIIYDEENFDAIKPIVIGGLDNGIFGSSASPALGRDINPSKLFGVDKKPTVKRLNEEEIPFFTETEFLQMISGGNYQVQYMYLYANLETGVLGQGTSQIEKLDLTQTTYLKTIEDYAFQYSPLQEIKLPEGIQEIGESAFAESQIKVINLPSSITSIGGDMFSDIEELTKLEIATEIIPDGLSNILIKNLSLDMETIPKGIFTNGTIENLTIGTNVKTIEAGTGGPAMPNGDGAFFKAEISNLIFEPNSQLTTIGKSAFANNKISGTLTIPASVETIGNHAFYGNQISDVIFDNGSNLKEISGFDNNWLTEFPELPSTVTTIGEEAFASNQLEKTLTLPEGIVTLGERAFYNNQLGEVTIPSSVTTIAAEVFWVNQISKVIFENTSDRPSQLTTIGDRAFYVNQISGELVIPASVTRIAGSLYNGVFADNQITSVIFEDTEDKPSQLTSIGTGAFSGNDLKNNIVIPSSVTFIGGPYNIAQGAFANNPNLSTITIKRQNSDGMTLEAGWNGTAQVVYDPNYVG